MPIDSVMLAVFWALLFTDPFYADFGSSFQQLFLLCIVLFLLLKTVDTFAG